MRKAAVYFGVAVFYALHQDFWLWRDARSDRGSAHGGDVEADGGLEAGPGNCGAIF